MIAYSLQVCHIDTNSFVLPFWLYLCVTRRQTMTMTPMSKQTMKHLNKSKAGNAAMHLRSKLKKKKKTKLENNQPHRRDETRLHIFKLDLLFPCTAQCTCVATNRQAGRQTNDITINVFAFVVRLQFNNFIWYAIFFIVNHRVHFSAHWHSAT